MTTSNLNKAKLYFYKKDYKSALELFIKEKDNYGAGLCSLLLNNKKQAHSFWKKSEKSCPGCAFGLCALRIIELDYKKLPTFFQVRAFFEVYVDLFLQNEYLEWAENMISCCDELFTKNPEIYKFIARVLFSNGYFKLAITFCKRSLKFFYSDPEAFLILSQCHYLMGDLGESLDCINRTLYIADNYYPAIIFKNIIKEAIENKHAKKED